MQRSKRFNRPCLRENATAALLGYADVDGSTLSLDFTSGVLDSRFSFTRNSTGTYVNSQGYVATMAAAATNDPTKARFDWDPTTITFRGLLIEGDATNLNKYTGNSFSNPYWDTDVTNFVFAVDAQVTSPTGVANTASIIYEVESLSQPHHFHQASGEFTPAANTPYTMSVWVKQAEFGLKVRYVQLIFWIAGFGSTAYMNYDIQNGTVGTGGAGITASSITAYRNGWYRISATATSVASPTSSGFQLGISNSSSAARAPAYEVPVDNERSFYVWGAQTERGYGASSYIPAVASQGTRLADSCVISNITSCNYSTTNGSMYYEGRFSKVNDASYPWRAGFTKESTDERCFGFLTNSAGSSVEAKGPGATPTASVSQTIAVNTNYKIAWSLDASLSTGEIRKSSNGSSVSVSSATALTVTGTPTYFMFGQKGYELYFPCGTIKAFKYWPTTLSDGQLQARTT